MATDFKQAQFFGLNRFMAIAVHTADIGRAHKLAAVIITPAMIGTADGALEGCGGIN